MYVLFKSLFAFSLSIQYSALLRLPSKTLTVKEKIRRVGLSVCVHAHSDILPTNEEHYSLLC